MRSSGSGAIPGVAGKAVGARPGVGTAAAGAGTGTGMGMDGGRPSGAGRGARVGCERVGAAVGWADGP